MTRQGQNKKKKKKIFQKESENQKWCPFYALLGNPIGATWIGRRYELAASSAPSG